MAPRRYQYPHASLTSTGRVRDHNEDSLLAAPPLYVVADGLGGHEAGEVASNIALQQLHTYAPKTPDTVGLMRATQKANNAILKAVETGIGKKGMGSTLTAAVIRDGRIAIAQVGDSRAYLLRSGRLARMTEDHSVVAAMLRSGSITEAEARVHPQRSVITRALGSDPNLVIDTYEFETMRGDYWLLCTDGLHGVLNDATIEETMLANPDVRSCAAELVRLANDAGGPDNISVIVVEIDTDTVDDSEQRQARRSNMGFFFASLLMIAIIFVTTFLGLAHYAQNRAYLSLGPSGNVAIYEGVPDSIFGKSLSTLSEESTIPLDSLPILDQRLILNNELTFDSLQAAKIELLRYSTIAIPLDPEENESGVPVVRPYEDDEDEAGLN